MSNQDFNKDFIQRIQELERENWDLRSRLNQLSTERPVSRQQLSLLTEISNAIVSELDLARVLDLVAEKTLSMVDAESVMIPMINEARDEYHYVAAAGENAETVLDNGFPIDVGMCGWVLTHERPLFFGQEQRFELNESAHWEAGQTSAVLVPLFGKNRIIGGLSAIGKKGGGSFTRNDLHMMTLFANQVSVAIENARLVKELRETLDSLEQRVQARTAQLSASNRELEAFCYSASHDLRSPLRGIDGYSQILMDDYPQLLDDPGRHYLQRIRAATQHMGQVIDDLLRLSKMTRKTLQEARIDLTAIAQTRVERYRQQAAQRQVEVTVAPAMSCRGDPELITVVLDNLISNAWKFTRDRVQAEIEIGQLSDAGETVFFVRDNGCGFDMRFKDMLFKPFQRLHSDEDFSGAGIGLAMAERIVSRHAGRIWATSRVDEGTSVFFTLPGQAG